MSHVQSRRVICGLLFGLGLCGLVQSVALAGPYQIHRQPLPPGASRGLLNNKTALQSAPSPTAHRLRMVLKDLSVAVYGTQDGYCAIQLRNGTRGWVVASSVRSAPSLPNHCF